MLSTTEKYLIESIKEGDRKAFEYLFRIYYADLCKYAGNLVPNENIAEDMVMDIFVKLWEAENKLLVKTSLAGYLFTSVHNHCLNYLTRNHKRFTELKAETIEKLNAIIPLTDNSDLFDGIDLKELSQRIEKSVNLLPQECKKIFLMSRSDELPNKEIAARLGISENTVKVQIYRALKKMRTLLKDYLTGTNIFLLLLIHLFFTNL
jgi:RNA polymerase sigma-70 factor, ECF subfamily